MASLAEMLGNSNRLDMYRIANNERLPKRGKKRHESQMSKREKDFLFSKLKSVDNWSISDHALDRIEEKGIKATMSDIISTIHNSNIVEYHVAEFNGENDERILLSSNARINKDYHLRVVFSTTSKTIVSVWMNHKSDSHKTLDMRDYSRKVKILGMQNV